MWGRLKARWVSAVGGALAFASALYDFLKWAFDWGGRIDLLQNHTGSVGLMWSILINPPGWLPLVAVIVGVALMWWDLKWRARSPNHTGAAERATIEKVRVRRQTAEPSTLKPRLVIDATSLIILAMTAAVGAYLYFATGVTPQVSTPLPPVTAPPPRVQPAPPAVTESVEPRHVVEQFNYVTVQKSVEGLNGLQAQRIYDLYIGKWVRVSGPVSETKRGFRENVTASITDSVSGGRMSLVFEPKWTDRLAVMPDGSNLIATCRIAAFWGRDGLYLTDCELN